MKVLVIGAAGFLGKELCRDFSRAGDVLGVDKNDKVKGVDHLDLLNKEAIKDIFGRFGPELVLFPAAISAVDFIETNQDLAWKVNVEAVKETAAFSKKAGAFLVFYSTDYVFDGKNGPYSEEEKPNPINFYGRTKLEAEKAVQKDLKNFLIIRTCSIYGYEDGGKNYAMQVFTSLSGKKVFRAVADQYGSPTYVKDLSGITFELVKNRKEGIYNVVGPDYANRVRFANEEAAIFNFDSSLIEEISSEELRQPAERPKRGGLKIDKLKNELGITPRGLKEGLFAMKKEIEMTGR